VRFDDPVIVRNEYASEAGLRARASIYGGTFGEGDTRRIALEAIRAASPRRVLEVGCGWGEFAQRVVQELGLELVAIDQSERMVELARERGVDARVGDVQELPFADGEFDVSVANWMLYHVPDLDRGLAELARVLRPGGRLVATTNSLDHLGELWSLVGRDRRREPVRFFSETAEEPLLRHFARVERYDNEGTVVFEDRAAVQRYVASSVAHKHLVDQVPPLDGPLVANTNNSVFVAEKA
jgi:ubiquinone/menaquinone biosynthesis C-methylase UbiE